YVTIRVFPVLLAPQPLASALAPPPSDPLLFPVLPIRPPPTSTLFPYTTLFRSIPEALGLARSPVRLWVLLGGIAGCLSEEDPEPDRKSTRLNSSHEWISYAVFCLKKKK